MKAILSGIFKKLLAVIGPFFGFSNIFSRIFNLSWHTAIIGGSIVSLGLTIGFMFAYLGLLFTSLMYIYNTFHSILDLISNNLGSGVMGCFSTLLGCSHLDISISAGFTVLWGALSGILLLHSAKIIAVAHEKIHDQVWKLGVLIGQMLNSNKN